MNEAAQRAAIKTILEGVTDVGNVHDYERWAPDWSSYLDLFKTTIGGTDQIRGWTITNERMPSRQVHDSGHRRDYVWVLRGVMGLDDSAATEKTFRALAEDVIEEFEVDRTLSGVITNGAFAADGWPSLAVFEPRLFGTVLCHYAEIRMTYFQVDLVVYTH